MEARARAPPKNPSTTAACTVDLTSDGDEMNLFTLLVDPAHPARPTPKASQTIEPDAFFTMLVAFTRSLDAHSARLSSHSNYANNDVDSPIPAAALTSGTALSTFVTRFFAHPLVCAALDTEDLTLESLPTVLESLPAAPLLQKLGMRPDSATSEALVRLIAWIPPFLALLGRAAANAAAAPGLANADPTVGGCGIFAIPQAQAFYLAHCQVLVVLAAGQVPLDGGDDDNGPDRIDVCKDAQFLMARMAFYLFSMHPDSACASGSPLTVPPLPYAALGSTDVVAGLTAHLAEDSTVPVVRAGLLRLLQMDAAATAALGRGCVASPSVISIPGESIEARNRRLLGMLPVGMAPGSGSDIESPSAASLLLGNETHSIAALAQWPEADLANVMCAAALAISVPALDVRWHGVEPPLASEHQIRTAAWGALAHSILTRAVASNSALCRSLHHDPVYLHVLPTLLTCEHDAPRKAAGQAAAQALDAVSALSARSLLFRVLPPGEMARVSIELLDRGAEWSEAGVVFLNVLDRMSTWAQALVDNEPTAASAAAAVRYFGSFYLVGLTIGQAQHATDREFEMFSAVQAQVHDIVTSLLMKLRRLGEPGGLKGTWPSAPAPHSAALGELVVGLTKWARVKDAEIAATVYRVLDDTLKLARTKNIPLTKDAVDRVEKIATDAKRKKSQFDQKKRADLFTYVSWWRDGGAGRLTSSMSELALHPTSISAGAQGVHGRDTRDSSSRKPPKMSLATVAAQAGVILPTAVVDLSTTPPRPPTRTVVVDLSESPTSKKAPPNPLPLPPAPLPPAAVAPPKPYGISLLPPTHAALSTKGAKISSYFQPAVKPRASSPVVELDSSEVESASDDGEDHHAASATVSPTMGTLPGIPIASLAGSAVTAGRQKKVGLQPPKPMLGPPPGKMPKPSASLVPQLAPAPLPSFTKLKSREDVEREEREAKRTRELADEERKAALRAQMAERAAAAAAARPRPGTATSDGRRAMKVIEMPKNALGGRVLDGRMSRKSGLGMDDLQSGKKIHPPLPLPETFERAVVHWDYFASGPVPIYRYDGGSLPTEARKVWPRYNTVNEYYEQFEPLLLLEAWAQMQRSKEEGIGQTVEAEVGDVSMNSLTMEVKLMLPAKTLKEAGIIDMDVIYVSDGKEEAARKRLAAEGRLATLNVPLTPVATAMRPPPPPQAGQRAGGANSSFLQRLGLPATSAQANSAAAAGPALSRPADPSAVSFLAKVNGIVFNKQFAEVTLAVSLKVRGIRPQTMIRVARVFSLITQSREYSALVALPRMPLVEDILQSQRPPARPQVDVDEVLRIRQLHNLNQPQARAVLAAVTSPGITLIQGPPGTGKTKTILGLVGAFLRKTKAVLVCAPSNAAVDEVTKRLLRGVKDDATGANFVPRVVRVGNPDVIHPDARSVALDDLVDEELQRAAAVDNASGSTTEIDAKWKELLGDRTRMLADKDRLEAERSDAQDAGDLERSNKADMELKSLRTRLRGVLAALDAHRAARSENSRALDAARSATRVRLLERAQVVCTTLATAGQDQLTNLARGFDVVIIDEAAQSVELSSLIPLRLGAKQCVLVGDPNQLPPTVISQRAKDSDYDQSLFVRIMRERPENVMMLEIQYRMHPDISYFPSTIFYDGRLRNGVSEDTHVAPWYSHPSGNYGPMRFFDVSGQQSRSHVGGSFSNEPEVNAIIHLMHSLISAHPRINFCSRIGIITMYKEQMRLIKSRVLRVFGAEALEWVDVNTVDGFQGQEKDIILMSTVRADPANENSRSGRSIGFLADTRRMNVALTRARFSLFIVGSARALDTNTYWKRLIDQTRERGEYRALLPSAIPHIPPNSCPPNLRPPEYQMTPTRPVDGIGHYAQQTPIATPTAPRKRRAVDMDETPGGGGGEAAVRRKRPPPNATYLGGGSPHPSSSATPTHHRARRDGAALDRNGRPAAPPQQHRPPLGRNPL